MKQRNKEQGKRQAASGAGPGAYWARYSAWVKGMTRGQRLRYRLLQTAVILSVLIIVGYLAMSMWVRVPEVPDPAKPSAGPAGSTAQDPSFEGAQVPDIVRSGRREGVYTFLLAGRDVASGSTDTMLLLTYDTKAKTVRGLNLPRDTMVNVSTSSKRLNAVYAYNRGKDPDKQAELGMTALKQQVAKLTGITPDFYVLVEWEAIGELVDALGGVEFEVPFDMEYDDPYQDPPLHIRQAAGLRVLDGEDAMQVIRFRKSNDREIQLGDTGRLDIQQDFLKAVVKKCLQPSIFLKIPELVDIFVKNVKTDLTVGNLLAFAQLAYGMDPETGVSFRTAPLGDSFLYRKAALVTLSEEKLLEVLNDGMNPYLRDITASDLELLYRKGDGSIGVTNGTLADPAMAEIPEPEPPEEEDVQEQPEQSDGPEAPEGEQTPSAPESSGTQTDPSAPEGAGTEGSPAAPETDVPAQTPGEGEQTQQGSSGVPLPGEIDPEDIFPEPVQSPVPETPTQPTTQENTVAVLPSRPEPVDAAA